MKAPPLSDEEKKVKAVVAILYQWAGHIIQGKFQLREISITQDLMPVLSPAEFREYVPSGVRTLNLTVYENND